jgi:hypothetical protein
MGSVVRSAAAETAKHTEERMERRTRWDDPDGLIAKAAEEFPARFGLRAFPGKTFEILQSSSYLNGDVPVLYVFAISDDDRSEAFAKGTAAELRREVVSLKS